MSTPTEERRSFTTQEVEQMYGPKPWSDTEAMNGMQRGYLEGLPERWPDAECPEHCAIAFLDGMRRFRAAIADHIALPLPSKKEPVQWMVRDALSRKTFHETESGARGYAMGCGSKEHCEVIPLYVHPQPKPTPVLTVEQVMEAIHEFTKINNTGGSDDVYREAFRKFITAKATTTP
jgi:hypothetical protein